MYVPSSITPSDIPAIVDRILNVEPGAAVCWVALLKNGVDLSVDNFA